MKKIYLVLLATFMLTFVKGQNLNHLNYDLSSKWFFGINGGATWSTTDVDDKLDLGWGLTLGRSFNYNYGKVLSFDLRGRYLRGFWYGQDLDTTSLDSYQGGALSGYYADTLGYTVNNFQADLHRLSFELVIHLNWLREKTKFDPYIFGGAGITWNQTYGDLYDQTFLNEEYAYQPDGSIGFGSLSSGMDGIYDSALDGSKQGEDNYTVSFMPSLGFGLGYQLSNNVSIGLEHKTTFTLKDDFDGYNKFNDGTSLGIEQADKRANDLYHYTSAYLRLRLPGKGNVSSPSRGNTSTSNGCKSPKIYLASGLYSTLDVRDSVFTAKAKIKYMFTGGDVFLVNQNGDTLNHAFNSSTTNFEKMYEEAYTMSKGRKVLVMFQKLLKEYFSLFEF